VTTERQPRPVAEYWAERVETIRGRREEGFRTLLFDATSDGGDKPVPVAAGAVELPESADAWDLDRLAFGLRDLLQQAAADPTISVTVCDQDDDGAGDAAAWRRRGVAEAGQPFRYCVHHGEESAGIDPDWFCPQCHPDWPQNEPGAFIPVIGPDDEAEADPELAAELALDAAGDDFDDEEREPYVDEELLNELDVQEREELTERGHLDNPVALAEGDELHARWTAEALAETNDDQDDDEDGRAER
jgi:hypothetical protein